MCILVWPGKLKRKSRSPKAKGRDLGVLLGKRRKIVLSFNYTILLYFLNLLLISPLLFSIIKKQRIHTYIYIYNKMNYLSELI